MNAWILVRWSDVVSWLTCRQHVFLQPGKIQIFYIFNFSDNLGSRAQLVEIVLQWDLLPPSSNLLNISGNNCSLEYMNITQKITYSERTLVFKHWIKQPNFKKYIIFVPVNVTLNWILCDYGNQISTTSSHSILLSQCLSLVPSLNASLLSITFHKHQSVLGKMFFFAKISTIFWKEKITACFLRISVSTTYKTKSRC